MSRWLSNEKAVAKTMPVGSISGSEWKLQWKTKKYSTAGTVPKFNRKIVERGKINTSNMTAHFHGVTQPL